MDKFYDALGVTEKRIQQMSDERLDRLAAGWFIGHKDNMSTNFFIPNQYHVSEVYDDHIRISIYPNFKKGYEEITKVGAQDYRNLVHNIKLGWDDFYVMGHAF